jgi:hypothetical protein
MIGNDVSGHQQQTPTETVFNILKHLLVIVVASMGRLVKQRPSAAASTRTATEKHTALSVDLSE